jgi:ASC-1-like (ASCH) protein
MGLQPKYFDYIKNGTKRIELRLYDEKRKHIRIGDIIEFSDGKNKMQVKVVGLLRYDTFRTLFKDFDISILSDTSMSKEEMLDVMEEFYPIEKQRDLGVIGIRIELI